MKGHEADSDTSADFALKSAVGFEGIGVAQRRSYFLGRMSFHQDQRGAGVKSIYIFSAMVGTFPTYGKHSEILTPFREGGTNANWLRNFVMRAALPVCEI
jgi:hypothetical protein